MYVHVGLATSFTLQSNFKVETMLMQSKLKHRRLAVLWVMDGA